jgi:hypothetical protein
VSPSDSSNGERSGQVGKVARLLREYDLDGLGDELEYMWTADGEDRRSLRDLAEYFNRQLFEQAIRDHDGISPGEDTAHLYDTLTSEAASSADRVRVRRRLTREGLDIQALEDEFVSYQAIRTYLRNHRNARYERPETDRIAEVSETVGRLQSRTATVAEARLARLNRGDEIETGSLSVTVSVRATCEGCGTQFTIDELLDQQRCDCE